jgi:hypothetical protein
MAWGLTVVLIFSAAIAIALEPIGVIVENVIKGSANCLPQSNFIFQHCTLIKKKLGEKSMLIREEIRRRRSA